MTFQNPGRSKIRKSDHFERRLLQKLHLPVGARFGQTRTQHHPIVLGTSTAWRVTCGALPDKQPPAIPDSANEI